MKTKNLWTVAATFILAAFAGGCKDDNVEKVGICPIVVSTNPASSATGVPLDQTVTMTFNVAMNPATITPAAFTLTNTGLPGGRIGAATTVQGTLRYDAASFTMSFTPDDKLQPKALYSGRVSSVVKDLTGNALQTDYIWTFSTGLAVSPKVTSTDPDDLAVGVLRNKTVEAKFNSAMDSSSISSTTFLLKQGETEIPGTVSYLDSTASFKPDTILAPNATYVATITTSAKDVFGNFLTEDYSWSFTTDSIIAPKVISTDPDDLAVGVLRNKIVEAKFNLAMDSSSITATTFILKQGVTQIAGTVSYLDSIATFKSNSDLASNTTYVATITTGVKDAAGNFLAEDYSWSFTTETITPPTVTSTDPEPLATGVALNKVISAVFSEAMNSASVVTSFTVSLGGTNILGMVNYAGTTATFTPAQNLMAGSTYTATIKATAKNDDLTPLANDYVWTFTTEMPIPPTVTSTDPGPLATGVALNKVISVVFSEAMNSASVLTAFTVSLGGTNVPGTVNYAGTTATFTPAQNLISGSTYTATMKATAKNEALTPLANDHVWTFNTVAPLGPMNVDLKSVGRFGIIAGVGVSNNAGFSEIRNLDVGISPGVRSSITGFPPAIIVNGASYASDDIAPPGTAAMLTQAKQHLTDAYLFAEGATAPAPVTVAGDQGGTTLPPGLYKSNSSLLIQAGNLTLDGMGDINAVWIFQIASDFTTVGGAGGNVLLINGAQAKNVYWQTGSSATIGDGTSFKGNVMALTSITMNSGAVAEGRMLARNGSVVMTNTNIINKP